MRLCFRDAAAAVLFCLSVVVGATTLAAQPTEDPSPALMRALMAWAEPRLDLPVPDRLPLIVRKTHCEIHAIVTQRSETCPEDTSAGFQALYASNVMWLRDDWRGDRLKDVSDLLHELVHHMQFHAGVPETPCKAEAWERPAYDAQMAFLEAAGVDVYETMNINGLMLVFITSCMVGR